MNDLRLATPADNAALLSLFGRVPMEGQLVLSTQRAPDFFALYRLQRGAAECWVADGEGGELIGMGTILVRDGWLAGQPARVGYLGDLRARFSAMRQRGLARFYGRILQAARERHGCDAFLTAVLASNSAALQALVRRSEKRPDQPWYHPFRRFALKSIQLTGGRRPPRGTPFAARRAEPADVPALAAFLASDHQRRPFGYRFDQGELEHRLRAWPGFSLESTWLAVGPGGDLAGCTTAWDPVAVKRYQVEQYRGGLRWQKAAYNAAARALGWAPLPSPGSPFRTLYLCNTSIAGDDPRALAALLEAVYRDARPRGYQLLSAPLYDGDPLAPAFRGFFTRSVEFQLYVVTAAGAPRTGWPTGRPGFEPALA
ncbi:MAG TPA: GNAT family N-acetyltransferase [Myxococcaceae bacterium]|jgi:hypothetical protein